MSTAFPQRYRELAKGFGGLAQGQPAVMDGFSRMHRGATTNGVLTGLTKELMALAIGITSQCTGCIAFHVHDAIKAGATRAHIEETIGVAVFMGGGPATIYGVEALAAFEEFTADGLTPST